ncbi:hypothetical protein AB0383_20530 [Amycolatopsis sp. NPDC051373]|uniref:hypothetical protein n=1 Tax=Amycolatopsis sp. NPDC051373 TaxID=3155801 RepID=UPI003450FCAB
MSWFEDFAQKMMTTFAPAGVLECPIDGCDARFTVPDVRFSLGGGLFTSNHVAFTGVPLATVEEALRGHFESHEVIDLLQTIRNRDYEIRGLRAALDIQEDA